MALSTTGNHLAPTPTRPTNYTLFFIPARVLAEIAGFFADLEEPDDYFLLVPAMRVDQLAWKPERIKRGDVRGLTNHDGGVWVALSKPEQAAQLQAILNMFRHD